MSTAVTVIIIVVVLVLAALVALMLLRRKKEREGLQERFGPEYDRAVEHGDSRRKAEHHLADVASRRDKAEIRDLDPQERERYSQRWTAVQAAFVDDPVSATRDADELVGDVMRDRGYPLDDVDNRADLVATDHAELAGHYRAAHEVGQRAGEASTEELRRAFVHYRALFVELLAEPQGRHEQPDRTGEQVGRTDERVDLTERDQARQVPPA